MKKVYLLACAIISIFVVQAQTTIYSLDFSGGSAGITLGSDNIDGWTVDNDYSCPVPNRSGGNYLHIYDVSDLFGTPCATYGISGSAADVNADFTTDMNTTLYSSVSISFWWLCVGYNQLGLDSYGSVWYSTDGGSTWSQFTSPRTEYVAQSSWVQTTITSASYPALLNQTKLRLRFHWHNSGIGSNPSFSIDDLLVTGTGGSCTNVGGTATANPTSVCSNQTSVIGLGGSTGTIQWQQSANGTSLWANVTGGSGATTTAYTTAALAATTYYRAVLSQASCPDQTSAVTSVTVSPTVTPALVITLPPGNPCVGDTLLFTAVPGNGGSSPGYQWMVGNNPVGTSSPTYSSSTLQNGNIVTCVMTSNVACATTPQATSNQLSVFEQATVTPAISIHTDSTAICEQVPVTFTSVVTDQGADPVYQWKVNGINSGTGTSFSPAFVNDKDTIVCVLTSNATCASPKTVTSAAIGMTVYPAPQSTIANITPLSFCEGDSVELSAANDLTYLWSTGDTSQSIIVKNSGIYSVSLSTPHCQLNSPGLTVTVYSLPPVPTVTLTNDTFTSSPATTYAWYLNDAPIVDADQQSYIAHNAGNYSVQITNDTGCVNTSAKTYFIITGIKSLNDESVSIYPNPAYNQLYISYTNFHPQWLLLYDVNGKMISEQKVTPLLDVAPLSSGIYFIELKGDDGTARKRFVKIN